MEWVTMLRNEFGLLTDYRLDSLHGGCPIVYDDNDGKAAVKHERCVLQDYRYPSFAKAGTCLLLAARMEDVKLVLKVSPNTMLEQENAMSFACMQADCRRVQSQ